VVHCLEAACFLIVVHAQKMTLAQVLPQDLQLRGFRASKKSRKQKVLTFLAAGRRL
jgi:hypothetical protein